MTRFGPGGPFGPRPTVPHQLWGMSREEIVKTLTDAGFSRKMAERDADEWLAFTGATKHEPSQEKDARKDSVSEIGIGEWLRNVFGRGGD